MTKLTAADLFPTLRLQFIKIMNYGGTLPEETRTKTMNKVMDILAHIDIDITATEVELECNETGDGE
jgi:hypothetical protein